MNDDIQALRDAISALVDAHQNHPFGILREVGVQAELKRLTDHFLHGRTMVMATIMNKPSGIADPLVETDRVRLEGKIHPSKKLAEKSDVINTRTDLLLYRKEGVRLFRHASGYGDIVYKALFEDVLAAVEIKASPSSQKGQRISYAKDITRLLDLNSQINLSNQKIEGFFVLLDKSSQLYAQPSDPSFPAARITWPLNEEPMSMTAVFNVNDAAYKNIMISTVGPAEGVSSVEVWNVSAAHGQPRRLFAFRT